MRNIFFVDSENVGDSWLDLLDHLGDNDLILVFYTDRSPHMSYTNLIRLKHSTVDPEFIHCENGTENALDFQLTTYLGFLASKNPKDHLVIVSKDKGFDAVIHFWTERGYQVARNTPSMFHTLSEPESEPEGTVKPKSVSSPADNTDSDLKQPTLTEEQKQQLDTLLACTGKADLSAVHNILRSIYGQETGGFLYNQVKKASYEIATVNWQKKTKYRKYLHIVYSNAGAKLNDDFFRKLYPQRADLKSIHNLFISKYGQKQGTTYYRIYKNHAEYLKKTF